MTLSGAPNVTPDPEGGWSEEIRTLDTAVIVPPLISGLVQPAGILDRDGGYCEHGALWRKTRAITTQPDPPGEVRETLSGRWLWGGVLWVHFGHFLVESSSRLWALDQLDDPVDGIVFMPKRPRKGAKTFGFQRDFINLMAPDLPIKVAAEPTTVETLVVPGQGFGIGDITRGTRSFRAALGNRFASHIPAGGPDRLYISRSALGMGKGGLLGEEKLEKYLTQQGYEVFHPEKHAMSVQVARYKAAKHVIAADGSALHLFAMVGRADQKVAIISRRKSVAQRYLAENVASFCGAEPLRIQELRRQWALVGKEKDTPNRSSFGELDLTRIGAALADAGFIDPPGNWENMSDPELDAFFEDKGFTGKNRLKVTSGEQREKVLKIREERRARRDALNT